MNVSTSLNHINSCMRFLPNVFAWCGAWFHWFSIRLFRFHICTQQQLTFKPKVKHNGSIGPGRHQNGPDLNPNGLTHLSTSLTKIVQPACHYSFMWQWPTSLDELKAKLGIQGLVVSSALEATSPSLWAPPPNVCQCNYLGLNSMR